MSFSSSSNSSKEAMLAATANGGTGGGGGGGGDNNDDDSSYIVVKGKRTKRQRSHNSAPPVATTGSSTTTSAGSYTSTTEEEEDMANCLILLAQGPKAQLKSMESGKVGGGATPKVSSRRYIGPAAAAAASTSTEEKVGFYMYECKTCNKRFPSFQALGGHRTSHKKPKLPAARVAGGGSTMEGKKSMEEDFSLQISIASFPKPIVVANNNNNNGGNKTRVHECSICGSEFSSGQALGGHMRRHRPVVVPTAGSSLEPKKEKSLLSLDLNLPAPSDEDREDFVKSPSTSSATTFPFGTGKPSVLFSALVDCHY